MVKMLPVIGVMGSGKEEHKAFAEPLGAWLATLPVHLLTGGGRGVMTSVSRAYTEIEDRKGLAIGVLPVGKEGYPNPYVELPIQTHLGMSGTDGENPLSRNHINVLSADIVIALPGRYGTSSEVKLALKYNKPVMVFSASRNDIPALPEVVPWTDQLDVVKAWVATQLNL